MRIVFRGLIILGPALLMLLVSTKKPTKRNVVQVSKPLSIQSQSRSPARAAFDSLFSKREKPTNPRARVVFLQTQDGNDSTMALRQHRIFTQAMVIDRAELRRPEPMEPASVAGPERSRDWQPLAQAKVERAESDWMSQLTDQELKMIERAQREDPNFLRGVELASTERLVDEKFRALAGDQGPAEAKEERAPSGAPIVTAGGVLIEAGDASEDRRAPLPRRENESVSGRFKISGEINIPAGAGIAMLEGHSIEVFWLNEGVVKSNGRMDADYKYQIEIEELAGAVTAVLLDKSGREVARGSRRISVLDSKQKLGSMHLELRDRNRHEVAVRGVSNSQQVHLFDSSSGDEIVFTDGSHILLGHREGSIMGIRLAASGFHPMLCLSRAGKKSNYQLFSSASVQSLLAFIDEETLVSTRPQNKSLVWGKVTLEGKPVEGVRIELESMPEEKPLYFNNAFDAFYFPNRELKVTSKNGLFAFAHLPRGIYPIKAYIGNSFFGHGLVEVDDRTLSFADVQGTRARQNVHLKTFDAFAGFPIQAQVELQSVEKAILVNGYSSPTFPKNDQLGFYQAEFSDSSYLPTQGSYTNDQESIFIPGIREEWVKQIQQTQRITMVPETGFVVLFTPQEIGGVSLPHSTGESAQYAQLMYFDVQGNLSPTSVSGGGVIIFNVSEGTQTVVVEEKEGIKSSFFLPVTRGWVSTAALSL